MACVGGGESCKFVIWAPTRVYPTQCLGGLWASIAAQVIGVMVVKSKSVATGQKYVKQGEVHHGNRSRHCAKHVTFADRDTHEESQAQGNCSSPLLLDHSYPRAEWATLGCGSCAV